MVVVFTLFICLSKKKIWLWNVYFTHLKTWSSRPTTSIGWKFTFLLPRFEGFKVVVSYPEYVQEYDQNLETGYQDIAPLVSSSRKNVAARTEVSPGPTASHIQPRNPPSRTRISNTLHCPRILGRKGHYSVSVSDTFDIYILNWYEHHMIHINVIQ